VHKAPQEYIKSIITGKADRHNSKSQNNYTIVCGDFNHRWNTGKYQLQKWVEENNWAVSSIVQAKDKVEDYHTFFNKTEANSWIDHLLIAPATAASVVLSTTFFKGNLWVDISDHRPIMIGLNLPGVIRGVVTKKEKSRNPPSPLILTHRIQMLWLGSGELWTPESLILTSTPPQMLATNSFKSAVSLRKRQIGNSYFSS